jgi:hypothetical protein
VLCDAAGADDNGDNDEQPECMFILRTQNPDSFRVHIYIQNVVLVDDNASFYIIM